MRLAAAVSVFALATSACQPEPNPAAEKGAILDTWLEANREAGNAQIERFRAVAAAARARPPLERDAVEPTTLRYFDPATGVGDTEILALVDIEAPGTRPPFEVMTTGTDTTFLHEMVPLLATGKEQEYLRLGVATGPNWPATRKLDNALKRLVGLEYLVVVKETEYAPPHPSGGRTFVPGKFRADALVYRLADTACLGGARIAVTNRSEVTAYDGNLDTYLVLDLEGRVNPAVKAQIAAAVGAP